MATLDDLRSLLEEAREDLRASAEHVTLDAFTHVPPNAGDDGWSVRDILWHAGYMEDWRRRVIKQGLEGSDPPPLEHRIRPAHLDTPALLLEWVEQSRRPVLSLLRRMSDDDLDRRIALAEGGETNPREQLRAIVEHDREHAAHIRALRSGTWATGPDADRT